MNLSENLSWIFHGSFRDLSVSDLSGIFQESVRESFRDLSRIFQGSFNIFQESFKDLSGILHESFSISFYFSPNIFECRISISILKVKKKSSLFFSPGFILKFVVDIYFNLS